MNEQTNLSWITPTQPFWRRVTIGCSVVIVVNFLFRFLPLLGILLHPSVYLGLIIISTPSIIVLIFTAFVLKKSKERIPLIAYLGIICGILLIMGDAPRAKELAIKYFVKKRVESRIISLTGKEYFKRNFKLINIDLSMHPAGPYLPSVNLEYKFIPFSGTHDYMVNVSDYSPSTWGFSSSQTDMYSIPPCALEKTNERCEFVYSYSQAYDAARLKLGELSQNSISIRMSEEKGAYFWRAEVLTKGEAYCEGEFAYVDINPTTGSMSAVQTWKFEGCV